jgi:malate/lactate dehydrogenase
MAALTVRELIERLEMFPDDAQVIWSDGRSLRGALTVREDFRVGVPTVILTDSHLSIMPDREHERRREAFDRLVAFSEKHGLYDNDF